MRCFVIKAEGLAVLVPMVGSWRECVIRGPRLVAGTPAREWPRERH